MHCLGVHDMTVAGGCIADALGHLHLDRQKHTQNELGRKEPLKELLKKNLVLFGPSNLHDFIEGQQRRLWLEIWRAQGKAKKERK